VIYLLVQLYRDWAESYGPLGVLRPLTFVEFRAILAIIVSFATVLLLGRRTINWLIRQRIGDHPEFYHRELNRLARDKSATPTMGGILISGSILGAALLLADLTSFYVQMGLLCLVWLTTLGGVDDWLKLTAQRRRAGSREGLYTWEKFVLQIGLAVILGVFIYNHGSSKFATDPEGVQRMSHALNLPFIKSWDRVEGDRFVPAEHLIVLGRWTFVCLTVLVIVGASNAVNLTDGMDGLASGIVAVNAFAFAVLAFIAGFEAEGSKLAQELLVPHIPLSDELAVLAAAMVGSCLGFLWFNCHPAQVFMGDTGSLALGGLLGYIAVVIRQEILLLIIGGIFVLEAMSVILQVGYFKITGGKRIFRCAPIHHHFHLGGWTEQQVVVRFWLISAVLAAVALATIKLR